jgi:hypothetical protein
VINGSYQSQALIRFMSGLIRISPQNLEAPFCRPEEAAYIVCLVMAQRVWATGG